MTQTNLDRLKAYADAHAQLLTDNCSINPELYQTYGVKRGLRDQKGRGVLAGLTNISEIESNKQVNGETVPCEGRLFYRGYDITELVGAEAREHRFGFEEIAYLLLFGELPTREELIGFQRTLADSRTLPTNFVRDVIMKAPSRDMMNSQMCIRDSTCTDRQDAADAHADAFLCVSQGEDGMARLSPA